MVLQYTFSKVVFVTQFCEMGGAPCMHARIYGVSVRWNNYFALSIFGKLTLREREAGRTCILLQAKYLFVG